FRNTDERYGVKVVSEEVGFLDWQITEQIYNQEQSFPRLKSLGFETLEQLREFGKALQMTMMERDYDLNAVIEACHSCLGDNTDRCEFPLLMRLNRPGMVNFLRELDIPKLKAFALKFMEDCYEVCNVAHYGDDLNPEKTAFNLRLRRFRERHRWLHDNLVPGTDRFNKVSEETHTVFYGLRMNPNNPEEQIAMVTHMGGEPITVTLGDWLQLDLTQWECAIASPNLKIDDLSCFELQDTQGVLLKSKFYSATR
ncbi:MAG: glucosylglycerol hydrolase, partial [Halothece sp. Uz-M2-17]|nr:glucosylglycerol hydrolase [Halothece sp. Uz-M2-17]